MRGCSTILMPSLALVHNKMKQSKNNRKVVQFFQCPRWTAACVSLVATCVLPQWHTLWDWHAASLCLVSWWLIGPFRMANDRLMLMAPVYFLKEGCSHVSSALFSNSHLCVNFRWLLRMITANYFCCSQPAALAKPWHRLVLGWHVDGDWIPRWNLANVALVLLSLFKGEPLLWVALLPYSSFLEPG